MDAVSEKKSQGALNVKKNANLCAKEKYLCVLLLTSGVQPSRKMPSNLEVNELLKNKQRGKNPLLSLLVMGALVYKEVLFSGFLCSHNSSNPISL